MGALMVKAVASKTSDVAGEEQPDVISETEMRPVYPRNLSNNSGNPSIK